MQIAIPYQIARYKKEGLEMPLSLRISPAIGS
jgi:hypothetical protein